MERGPMALFGAIVAVGLGPAMWLGAQFGATSATPSRPPAVSSELQPNQAPTEQKGGGAGSAPEDPSLVVKTRPQANDRPLHSASPSPSASATADRPKKDDPTTEPTKTTASPSPSTEPSTPPTEESTEPTESPTVAPSPPSPDAASPAS